MNRDAMWAIALKDMRGIRNSIQIWLPMLIVPLMLCVVLPGGLILGVRYYGVENMGNMSDLDSLVRKLEDLPIGNLGRTIGELDSPEQQILYLTVNYLFVPFFLLVPLMLSCVITANSFAAEKERRTLETLLFSPVDIPTLFVGKVLSAFVPSIAISLLCFVLYGVIVDIAAYPVFGRLIFPTVNWMVLILWTIPSITLFTIFLNVIISARVKGFQEAYQMGGFLVLPVVGLILGQTLGAIVVDIRLLWWGGLVILVLALLLLRFIRSHFDRNKLFESQVS